MSIAIHSTTLTNAIQSLEETGSAAKTEKAKSAARPRVLYGRLGVLFRQVAGSFGNPEIIFADLKRPLRAVNNTLNGGERTCAHHRNFRRTASSQP